MAVDEAITALRALVEHRDDVVKIRTQTVNRLHVLLTQLLPAGAPRQLSAEIAAQLLRTVRPRTPGPRMLRRLAAELIAEIRHLDRRIAAATSDITAAVAASNTTLTELCGIGDLTAGKILARVGDITRFPSAAAFASYTGTAPIEVSSGDVVRHRLSRAGDRQLNSCLHVMAITQIRRDTPGRAYYQRKRAAGKSHKEALRCLKRRLSDTVYRHLHREAPRPRRRAREDTRGRLQNPARPAQPLPPALRTSHSPDPPAPSLQPINQDLLDTERCRSFFDRPQSKPVHSSGVRWSRLLVRTVPGRRGVALARRLISVWVGRCGQ